jgi:hypothetical protein
LLYPICNGLVDCLGFFSDVLCDQKVVV